MSSINLSRPVAPDPPISPPTNISAYYKVNYRYTSLQHLERGPAEKRSNMHGVKRVFAFCCLTAILPAFLIIFPLYLKHVVFKDYEISVAESDILEVRDGLSTIFCQEHLLKMNTSFNAFQLNHKPDQSKSRKHIRLKKSMILPDDTLEYWGFYLMKGATVELKVCSRYDGSRILVVKGERNLRTCGLMDHNKNKFGANFNAEQSQVKVTYETAAEIVNSGDITMREDRHKYAEDKPMMDDEAMLNHGGEELTDFEDDTRKKHKDFATNYLKHGKNEIPEKKNSGDFSGNGNLNQNETLQKHHKRHQLHDKHHEVADKEGERQTENLRRRRSHKNNIRTHREKPNHNQKTRRDTTILDGGINHGGNAQNFVPNHNNDESNSISSFENALLECYDGNILVAKSFDPSKNCNDVKSLEQGSHLVSTHEVNSDGYYYYIFYSDNDYDSNHIHAVFDIYKPTYLYSNISETKGCINMTECRFPIQMFSDEIVIVEVPTRDGIEHEDDDITFLYSQCVPRTAVYAIFPILVLVFILGCAFI